MAPKKRKTNELAPAAKKPRSKSSKAPKRRTATKADFADIEPLAKEALAEIGDGPQKAADVARKINEILHKRREIMFDHASLASFLSPSQHGKALGIKKEDTYPYVKQTNQDLLDPLTDDIAFVEKRDGKGVPIMFRDLAARYLDRGQPNGVVVKSEVFSVENGEDPELTKERARVSALAKLTLKIPQKFSEI